MLAGAVVIRELMRAGGYDSLTVSENSLLAGAASTIGEVLAGEQRPWAGRQSCRGWRSTHGSGVGLGFAMQTFPDTPRLRYTSPAGDWRNG